MQGITEQNIACNYPEGVEAIDFELNFFGTKKRNVFPQVDLYYAHFENLTPRLVDFIEIATSVYLADQHVVRCQGRVDEHGWLWRRKVNMFMGVRDVEFWQQSEVCEVLSRLLRFLSDDCFTFQFSRMTQEPPPQQQYLHFKEWEGAQSQTPERVMLFSGGLDSLGGAIQSLITEGKRTVLVRHKTFTNHKDQYATLEHELYERSNHKSFFFTVKTESFKDDKHEYTQRCRSFLYFSLAATIAHLIGLDEVNFYENGPISINLAMNPQVVGGRATRTTHPQTLFFFQKLFRIISSRENFRVSNPFWDKTKAEIVKEIIAADCGDLIKHTMSCAHTWMQDNVKLHCGVCSQCIDRRVAIIAAGAQEYDKADGYKVDFFSESVDAKYNHKVKEIEEAYDDEDMRDEYHFDEPNKNLLTSYFLRGKQILDFEGYYQFEDAYPMICDALLYMPGLSPDYAAQRIYKLHQRLAREIQLVCDYAISKEFLDKFRAIPRQIAPDSLCGILLAIPRTECGILQATADVAQNNNSFTKMGQMWQCRFNGGLTFFISNFKGNEYLRELLQNPGEKFSYERLSPSPINTDVQKWLDKNAVGYSEEISQLEKADKKTIKAVTDARDSILCILEDPQSTMSEEEREYKQEQLEKLNGYLRSVVGKNGEPRRSKTPYQYKRDRVIKNINETIDQIASCAEGKEMAQHLKAQLKFEDCAMYMPISGIAWSTINR